MKKALALLTCALMVLGLTACSQQKDNETSSMASGVATMAGSSELEVSSVQSDTASVSSAAASSEKEASSKAASSKKAEASSKTTSKTSSKTSSSVAKMDSPTRVMGRMLEALKNDELDVALKYIMNATESDFPFADIPEAFDMIYTGIQHKINSENIENGKAYVVIDVFAADVPTAAHGYVQDVEKLEKEEAAKPAGQRLSGEKLKKKKQDLFVARLRKVEKSHKESIVEMVPHESKWKVNNVDQLTQAFVGNLSGYKLDDII